MFMNQNHKIIINRNTYHFDTGTRLISGSYCQFINPLSIFRAKKKTSGPRKSSRRRRTRGVGSTTHSYATCGRPAPCSNIWPLVARCAIFRRSWRTRPRNRTTRLTRTWSNAHIAVARSMRRLQRDTFPCALTGSGMQPIGYRTRNSETCPPNLHHFFPPSPFCIFIEVFPLCL